MSDYLNTFLIGSWDDLHKYSATAYHGLKTFLSDLQGGPYSLSEVYDRDGDGCVLVAIITDRSGATSSVILKKDGAGYTFSV